MSTLTRADRWQVAKARQGSPVWMAFPMANIAGWRAFATQAEAFGYAWRMAVKGAGQ